MFKTVLTVGLFDKDTETQLINSNEAKKIISSILIDKNNIFAFTMIDCSGVYKMQSTDCIVYEPSIRIEIATDKMIDYKKITSELKSELNQESIMVDISESNIIFE